MVNPPGEEWLVAVNALDDGGLNYPFLITAHENVDWPFIAKEVILVDQKVQHGPRAAKSKRSLNIS